MFSDSNTDSDGMLYTVKVGGIVSCFDSGNGEVIYAEKLGAPGPYLSSPLLIDGLVYLAS